MKVMSIMFMFLEYFLDKEENWSIYFIKGRAPGKLTGCEDSFARLLLPSLQL